LIQFQNEDPNYFPLIVKAQGFNVEDGYETFPASGEEDYQDLIEFDKDIPVFQKFLYGKRKYIFSNLYLVLFPFIYPQSTDLINI
jgi:hypothetical protein